MNRPTSDGRWTRVCEEGGEIGQEDAAGRRGKSVKMMELGTDYDDDATDNRGEQTR